MDLYFQHRTLVLCWKYISQHKKILAGSYTPKGTPFESTKNANFRTWTHFKDLDGADANLKFREASLSGF